MGDRPPLARHAAHRQPPAAPGARLRRGARRRDDHRRDGRARGLKLFGVDERGLDKVDRAILDSICRQFHGGPVGLSTLAIAVGEQPETVEDMYEPFLIQQGMIARTPRGPRGDAGGVRPPRPAVRPSSEPVRRVALDSPDRRRGRDGCARRSRCSGRALPGSPRRSNCRPPRSCASATRSPSTNSVGVVAASAPPAGARRTAHASRSTDCTCGSAGTTTPSGCSPIATPSSTARPSIRCRRSTRHGRR